MTTATIPARNGRVYADEPPAEIRQALEAVVAADKGYFADRMSFKRNNSDSNLHAVVESEAQLKAATEHAERLLDDWLGTRPNGCWPIAGRCVGFSNVSRYGMRIRVEPDRCTLAKKGIRT